MSARARPQGWRRQSRMYNKVAVEPKNLPVPANGDELAEMLADPVKRAPWLENTEMLAQLIQGYADKHQAPGTDLHATVAAETEKAMLAFLKDNEITLNRPDMSAPQGGKGAAKRMIRTQNEYAAGHNPHAAGAALDEEFADSAEYAHTVFSMHSMKAADRRAKIQNAFSGVTPADGGFLVPENLRSQLLQVALETAIVRQSAFVVPMESLRVPFPVVDSTSNVSSVFGGLIGYWTEEGGAATATSAKFGRVVLEAKKLMGYSEIPNELLADSNPALGAFVDRSWPQAIAHFEDVAFFTGNGVGQPLGFIGSRNPAAIAVNKETGQAAATIVWENVVKMFSRLLPTSLARAKWYVSPDTFSELATMALSVGTGGGPIWLNNGQEGPPMRILGLPVVRSEKNMVLGTRGDIVLADLSYYLVGDRQTMSAATSEHFKFSSDTTAIRLIQRVDGRPWLLSAITPQNNGPTLSAFVELQTRS